MENRALRRILGPKGEEGTGEWKKLHDCSGDQIEKNEMGGARSTYGREVNTRFSRGNLRKRYHVEDQDVDGRIILRWIFRK